MAAVPLSPSAREGFSTKAYPAALTAASVNRKNAISSSPLVICRISNFDIHDFADHQLRQNQAADGGRDQRLAPGMVVQRQHISRAEDGHHGGDGHGKYGENGAGELSVRRQSPYLALQGDRFAHVLGHA